MYFSIPGSRHDLEYKIPGHLSTFLSSRSMKLQLNCYVYFKAILTALGSNSILLIMFYTGLYQICKLTFCQTYTENLQFTNPSFYQTFILPTLQITKYQICKLTFCQTYTEKPSIYPSFILPNLHFLVTLRTSNLMI